MLSFGSAAFTADKQLVSTFVANLNTLPGAAAHPETMARWETQPEAWAAHGENLRDPEEAMPAYVAWHESVPGEPDFVGYPAGFDFIFTCWYSRPPRSTSRTSRWLGSGSTTGNR